MCSDWNRDQVYELIELYKDRPELWNTAHKDYNVRQQRQAAWHDIAHRMDSDVDTVKSKMASLLSSFRREKAKTKAKGDKPFSTTWFAYKCLSFLLDKEKTSNDNNLIQGEEEVVTVEAEMVNFKRLFEDCDYQAENPIEIKSEGYSNAVKSDDYSSPSSYTPTKKTRRDYHEDVPNTKERDKNALVKDECTTFADHIAVKLNKFDDRLRVMVMHRINSVIFEAEMDKLNEESS